MGYLIWAYIPFAVVVLSGVVLCLVPAMLLRLLGLRKAADALVFGVAKVLANYILWLLGVKVDLSGNLAEIRQRSRSGQGFCFVSNHTSMLDIVVMMAKMDVQTGFIAKRQLLFVPFLNIFIAMTHSVFINRKSLKKSVKAIRRGEANIRKGHSMVVFPEGTRSKTGEIGAFKHGSFRMATESGSCIVPVTIKGIRSSLEAREAFFQRRLCHVHVGEPVQAPKAESREAVSQMIADMENQIRETYRTLG